MPIDYSKLRNITAIEIVNALSRDGSHLRYQKGVRLFIISWKWVLENHREHRGHSNSLCPPCPLWLIFFAIIRVHPEKIKKATGSYQRYDHPSETPKPPVRREAIT